MKTVRIIVFCFLVVIGTSCYQPRQTTGEDTGEGNVSVGSADKKTDKTFLLERLRSKADSARVYCKAKGFSERHCLLVDFSIHSGKQRYFVWDFEKDTVAFSSLCAHGMGRESTQTKPVYSNDAGSYCSSLGRYKIGISSYSQYGIHVHYKLHGQDATNSNAYKRIVVLHSHSPIPDRDIYPHHLPLGYSLGCPVISDEAMHKTDSLLKKSEKPVMLWIYES